MAKYTGGKLGELVAAKYGLIMAHSVKDQLELALEGVAMAAGIMQRLTADVFEVGIRDKDEDVLRTACKLSLVESQLEQAGKRLSSLVEGLDKPGGGG